MDINIKISRGLLKQREPNKLKVIWQRMRYKWQALCDALNPKNKWLTKIIPNHYVENDQLIELVLFKVLVSYVEVEEGLTHFEWTVEDGELNYKQLIEDCYRNITVTIPAAQEKLNAMPIGSTYEDTKSYIDADDDLEKLKQDTCETIVKIMGVLWT